MARITDAEIAERVEGQTVPSRFLATVRSRPDAVALRWKDGDRWAEWTWTDYAERAARLQRRQFRFGQRAADIRRLGLCHQRSATLMRALYQFMSALVRSEMER